jgi:hypothetical protein
MGCDIHSYAEKKTDDGYEFLGFRPFDWRAYGMYAFLAGVRNYSAVTPLAERRGLPKDISELVAFAYEGWDSDAHSASWLSLDELTKFDYDKIMEDRRVMINNDGGCTAEVGGGQEMTYREFLAGDFFTDLEKLKELGADRIVFWFDN